MVNSAPEEEASAIAVAGSVQDYSPAAGLHSSFDPCFVELHSSADL